MSYEVSLVYEETKRVGADFFATVFVEAWWSVNIGKGQYCVTLRTPHGVNAWAGPEDGGIFLDEAEAIRFAIRKIDEAVDTAPRDAVLQEGEA